MQFCALSARIDSPDHKTAAARLGLKEKAFRMRWHRLMAKLPPANQDCVRRAIRRARDRLGPGQTGRRLRVVQPMSLSDCINL